MKFNIVKISVFVCLGSLVSFNVFSQHRLQRVGYSSILELPTAQPSLVIKYGDSSEHFIEGWTSNSEDSLDLVFIHGGCWLSDYDLSHARGLMSGLSEQGHNVWSMEYRRTGETRGGWPTSLNDIQNGLDTLVKEEAIKLENTVVLGHSAGGHLALLLGASNASL
jgi:acetyl esterase/lipase